MIVKSCKLNLIAQLSKVYLKVVNFVCRQLKQSVVKRFYFNPLVTIGGSGGMWSNFSLSLG